MLAEKRRVFISHAWEDKPSARQLEEELKQTGIEVWVDHSNVRGGDIIPQRVNEALDWCDTVILIWTKSAADSKWVEREWAAAIQLDKIIIPCLFDKTNIPNILTGLAHVDFRNYAEGINSLLSALGSDRPIEKPSPKPFNKRIVWAGIFSVLALLVLYLLKMFIDESNKPRIVIDSVVLGSSVSDTTKIYFSVVNRAGNKITITELNATTLSICDTCQGKPRGLRYDLGAHFISSEMTRMNPNDIIFKIDSEDSKSYSCRLYGKWLNESHFLNCLLGYTSAIEIRYIDNSTGEPGIIKSDELVVGEASGNCEET